MKKIFNWDKLKWTLYDIRRNVLLRVGWYNLKQGIENLIFWVPVIWTYYSGHTPNFYKLVKYHLHAMEKEIEWWSKQKYGYKFSKKNRRRLKAAIGYATALHKHEFADEEWERSGSYSRYLYEKSKKKHLLALADGKDVKPLSEFPDFMVSSDMWFGCYADYVRRTFATKRERMRDKHLGDIAMKKEEQMKKRSKEELFRLIRKYIYHWEP